MLPWTELTKRSTAPKNKAEDARFVHHPAFEVYSIRLSDQKAAARNFKENCCKAAMPLASAR